MKPGAAFVMSVACVLAVPMAVAGDPEKAQAKRESIDAMAQETLDRLFQESPDAKKLQGSAAGFAVFDNFKAAVLVSGGGGVGVAVDNATGKRTYMKMGTAGVGVGLGGQSYQVVFLFETPEAFQKFVEKGWQADASAHAVAGTSGANAPATFHDGVIVYQLTNKGLMAQADVAGTKYWKNDKLNE